MSLSDLTIDKQWTLFLDRDGVINRKLDNDYVKEIAEFQFLEGAIEAIAQFAEHFGKIIIVTNQQGIGKGIMSHEDLADIHDYMLSGIQEKGGRVDAVYYCPDLAMDNPLCRKPNTGMPEQARIDFPEINFKKSIMVGDSPSDIEMGNRLGMFTIFISSDSTNEEAQTTINNLLELNQLIAKK